MSDSSDTASDSSGSAGTSSQKDPVEDVTQGSQRDNPDKDGVSSEKGAANDHDTASRNGDGDANESGQGSQRGTIDGDGDGDAAAPTFDATPWYDLLEYMEQDKQPEYGAEGLVTLWNAQSDQDDDDGAEHMANDFEYAGHILIKKEGVRLTYE